MNPLRIIFFGSTSDSVIVLSKLHSLVIGNWSLEIVSVVTQPPRPVGRKQVLTPTPVEIWAKGHDRAVLSFPSDSEKPWLYASERQVVDALEPMKADLLVSACYGQKIPLESIKATRFGGLNVHPSILPRWRGADPVPWAIYSGDHQTGVSVVTLARKFDDGRIIAQKKVPIRDTDMSDVLRTKLFTIGADLLKEVLPRYFITPPKPPLKIRGGKGELPYARRLTRDDGFEPWEAIQKALEDPEEAVRIDRKFRAFFPWPGLWTYIEEKRLKILGLSLVEGLLVLKEVQLEGKRPVAYSTLLTAYGERLHLNEG